MFVMFDRRAKKVIAKAEKRAELPKEAKGLVVDTDHLERLEPNQMLALYHEFGGGDLLPPWAVAQVKAALEAAKTNGNRGRMPHTRRKARPANIAQVEGAVATVRAIAERMKGKPRKDIIAACVEAGVNENTAKTQYQRWFKANK